MLTIPPLLQHPTIFFGPVCRISPHITAGVRLVEKVAEHADDVTNPARRAVRDSLAANKDYVIRMRFMRETSFARQTMATIASTLTLTLAPMPYARHYSVTADVHDRTGRFLKHYERHATVTQWVETFLIFAYPFAPETRKTEEVYVAFLDDIFREIEADRVLAAR